MLDLDKVHSKLENRKEIIVVQMDLTMRSRFSPPFFPHRIQVYQVTHLATLR